jgi:hypothetical protein
VVAKGKRPQERNSCTTYHFTVLGFTTASGEPVMCAVVLAAKQLTTLEAYGFNCLVTTSLEPKLWKKQLEKTNTRMFVNTFPPLVQHASSKGKKGRVLYAVQRTVRSPVPSLRICLKPLICQVYLLTAPGFPTPSCCATSMAVTLNRPSFST